MDVYSILVCVAISQHFSDTLPFIIAYSWAYAVDAAPVCLFLRMLEWIAVTLRSRSEQVLGVVLARNIECAHGTEGADLQRVNSMDHVVHGTSRRGKMENVIDIAAVNFAVDIELQEFKLAFAAKMLDVR